MDKDERYGATGTSAHTATYPPCMSLANKGINIVEKVGHKTIHKVTGGIQASVKVLDTESRLKHDLLKGTRDKPSLTAKTLTRKNPEGKRTSHPPAKKQLSKPANPNPRALIIDFISGEKKIGCHSKTFTPIVINHHIVLRQLAIVAGHCQESPGGSYIPAMVKIEDQPRYRTRKGRIAQNVMAAVGFDLKFTYVLAGWEGSARDPKVLKAAVRDAPTKLLIPTACCTLHNFISTEDPTDLLEDEHCDDEEDLESNNAIVMEDISGLDTNDAWTTKRDELAIQMWNEYNS
ncbi:hypothetical protein HHK36_024196 [Tetracentron sinense]|uniref:Uncharacterized protein n=1 Tax=Tetracentron sinense TaxID=13715 RepID=A0A834YPA3_TETSI|nr:hypothetical protein HHK36_024196 [Tetracentron sinense]